MLYFSQMLGIDVLDSNGEKIGVVNDLGIATKEVFPRVTSLAFQGPGRTPFMISWRKYVQGLDQEEKVVRLKVPQDHIRFSYLQPEEVLISRDLLNKQIVDTRGLKVVRVNDVKLSDSATGDGSQLRLLGAEVGMRGLLRSLSPTLERVVLAISRALGHNMPEKLIAWSYMDLLSRDLKDVKLSVTHKTLDELHPADVADIIEQLDPRLRGQVFAQLDDVAAASAIAELDDDEMAAGIVGEMDTEDARRVLLKMNPDDAAELVSELDYSKAEQLLHLMGVKGEKAVRQLLGYREHTAGRIMTGEFMALPASATIEDAVLAVRESTKRQVETANYIYVVGEDERLQGVLSLKSVVIEPLHAKLADCIQTNLITCGPDDDQEDVAETISKYNLLALPVVEESGRMLGIVTVDDALDVMEEEHEEDLQLAGAHGSSPTSASYGVGWLFRNQLWLLYWAIGCVLLQTFDHIFVLGSLAVFSAVAMPIALVLADSMIDYVAGYALEWDEDDEDAPSILSFFWRGVGMLCIFLLLLTLVAAAVMNVMIPAGGFLPLVGYGFIAAGISALISFLSAPAYLSIIRNRDARGEDTKKLSLRLVALLIAVATYVLVVLITLLAAFAIA